jgi:site-specific DNA-methyltransferase (adenine-specific)
MGFSLHNGDCLEVMAGLRDASVDIVLADLPYGTTACAWDAVIPFEAMWTQFRRVTKPNAAIVLTACQPFTTALIASNFADFKYCWVWKNPQGIDPFMAKVRPLNNYEDVCVFMKGRAVYNPQLVPGKPYSVTRDKNARAHELTGATMRETTTVNEGTRLPTRILEFQRQTGFHPTQKPVALFEYFIRTYTNPGDVVLDNTMGSGTTGKMATQSGRRFIGIERDPTYFQIASKRIHSTQPPRPRLTVNLAQFRAEHESQRLLSALQARLSEQVARA